ncbi:MAG TPA: polymorphic toxin-type HINT domain-containing protein [Pilimelia sp.]|nr:polymorphic toxin-type HINT domain-containing protein [Pilimelia sp.]
MSDTRVFYDGAATFGAAPTKGLVTRTEQLKAYSGGTPQYVTVATASHDVHGRVVQSADALGRATTTAYTPATGGPLTRTVVTSPDPDGAGALTAHVTTTDLDPAFGVPTKVTDPNAKVTEAVYDPLGRLLKVWLPDRPTSGLPTLEFAYLVRNDGPVAVTTKKYAYGNTQRTSVQLFDGLFRPIQTQRDSLGSTGGRVLTDTRYDARGQVEATNAEYYDTGAVSTQRFVPSTVVPGRTEFVYDGAGRVTDEIFLKLGVEQWRTVTSHGGDRVSVDPPVGGTPTTTVTDARGRTTALWQYLGAAPTGAHQDTTYAYDHAGRLATVTDPAGNQWTYGYDLRGRQVSAVDPDRGATTSTYDDAGQLLTTTEVGRGLTLAYTYDGLGRKTALRDGSASGPVRASWVFDTLAKGHPTSATRYEGTAQYTTAVTGYDNGYRPLGRSVTLPSTGVPTGEAAIAGTYTTTYTYTSDGQLYKLKHPAAGQLGTETVTTNHNARGMPEWMNGGLGWGVYVAGSIWSAYGQPLLMDIGNTYSQDVVFDYEEGTNRLANVKVLRQNAAGYDKDATYQYDHAGNVTSIVDQPVNSAPDAQCFRYDGLRRLTEAWTPASANCAANPTTAGLGGPAPYWTSYTYDAVGNRLSEVRHATGGDTTRTYSYPAAGTPRPHAVTQVAETGPGGSKTFAYGYDEAGNTKCRPTGTASNTCPAGAGSQVLTWNAEGRLATVSGGQSSSYVYTADGERLLRREGGVTTVYLPDGQELRLTVATGAKSAVRYYSFAGTTVAVRTGTGLAGVSSLVSDHHGTAALSTANTTNVLTRRYHDPFGQPRGTAAPSWPGDHGFLDKPTDATGLTHVSARQYDPGLGRFISVDPIMDLADPQQWNAYAYANNNPTTFSDPSGLIIDRDRPGCAVGNGGHCSSPTPTPEPSTGNPTQPGGGPGFGREGADQTCYGRCEHGPREVYSGIVLPATMTPAQQDAFYHYFWRNYRALFCYENGYCRPDVHENESYDLFKLTWDACAEVGCKGSDIVPFAAMLESGAREGLAIPGPATGIGAIRGIRGTGGRAPRGSCATNSFLPDTPVVMADGSVKAIEDVRVGDMVLATDPKTGRTEPRRVTALITGEGDKQLVTIGIDSGRGQSVEVTATTGHPFWVVSRQAWVLAEDLRVGDRLRDAAGRPVRVTSVRHWSDTTRVHNLTVDVLHTYYVLAGDTPVLVHNDGGDDFNQARNKALEWLNARGFRAERQTLGRFGDIKGKPIGMQTADGKTGFRIEFDERNGAHINVWSGKEKGPHYTFNASRSTVSKLQGHYGCG